MKKHLISFFKNIRLLAIFITFSLKLSGNELPQALQKELSLFTHFNTQSIIDENTYKGLQIDQFLETILIPPSALTRFGLQKTIIPLKDHIIILQRQAIIKELVENQLLSEEVSSFHNHCINDYEQELFDYWDKNSPLQQITRMLYFKGILKRFNTNVYALQLHVALKALLSFKSLVINLTAPELFDEFLNSTFEIRLPNISKALKNSLKQPLTLHDPHLNVYDPSFKNDSAFSSTVNLLKKYSAGDWYTFFHRGTSTVATGITHGFDAIKLPLQIPSSLISFLAILPTLGIITCADYIYFGQCMDAWDNFKAFQAHFGELEQHMLCIADFFQDIQNIVIVLNKYPAFKNYESLQPLFEIGSLTTSSEKLQKTLKLILSLKKTRLTTKFKYGHMLLIFKYLQETKNELIPLLNALAELEALNHLSHIVRDHKNSSTPYCFAHIIENSAPFIQLTDFWLPLISKNAVTNSVIIGQDGLRNTLFTGPHWCGKSISIKGIAYAIICTQAFGITPAHSAQLSLFTGIRSAINITDDVFHGQSGFSAEKKRFDSILSFMKTAREKDCYCIILDEPITKTMPDILGPLVYNFGLEAAKNSRSMTLLSCNHPTALELNTVNSWNSYNVELLEPEENNFVRTFKIYPGIATWWTSTNPLDAAKRKRFIEWISKYI